MNHHLIEPIVGGHTPGHLIIAVDFDGTICHHPDTAFPAIGAPVPHAITVLKRLQDAGVRLMLWTMRDHTTAPPALEYLNKNGIRLWAYNMNPYQSWSQSTKQYAHLYIDDAALGCPLVRPPKSRAFVNWFTVEDMLIKAEVLEPNKESKQQYILDYQIESLFGSRVLTAATHGDTKEEAIKRIELCGYNGAPITVVNIDPDEDTSIWAKDEDEWPQPNPEDAIWKAEADAEDVYLRKVDQRGYL